MAYGFEIRDSNSDIVFNQDSLALVLRGVIEVTGASAYNETFELTEEAAHWHIIPDMELDSSSVDFIFNTYVDPGVSTNFNTTTNILTVSGTVTYHNVGMAIGGWSTKVANSKTIIQVFVHG
jgi:hypothetical protein